MKRTSKRLMLLAIAVPLLVAGVAFSQPTFADKEAADTKAKKIEKLKQLQTQQKEEMQKFQSMPEPKSQEELDQNLAQGKKVKDLGLEIGKLKDELYPPSPDDEVQERIRTLKRIFDQKEYYRDLVNDPVNGERYKKALEILVQKKETLEQIETDYLEKNKTSVQLLDELNKLSEIRELY